jgi:hypothetical protein
MRLIPRYGRQKESISDQKSPKAHFDVSNHIMEQRPPRRRLSFLTSPACPLRSISSAILSNTASTPWFSFADVSMYSQPVPKLEASCAASSDETSRFCSKSIFVATTIYLEQTMAFRPRLSRWGKNGGKVCIWAYTTHPIHLLIFNNVIVMVSQGFERLWRCTIEHKQKPVALIYLLHKITIFHFRHPATST